MVATDDPRRLVRSQTLIGPFNRDRSPPDQGRARNWRDRLHSMTSVSPPKKLVRVTETRSRFGRVRAHVWVDDIRAAVLEVQAEVVKGRDLSVRLDRDERSPSDTILPRHQTLSERY